MGLISNRNQPQRTVSFVGDPAQDVWNKHKHLWPRGGIEIRVPLLPREPMMKIPSIHAASAPSVIHAMTFRKERGGKNGRPRYRIVADDGAVVQDWRPYLFVFSSTN